MDALDFLALRDEFHPWELEWRVQTAGISRNDNVWAQVLCYVTNRAIQRRFDSVVGPENWHNEFLQAPEGGVMCGLSVRLDNGEWLTKYDAAENTDIEAVKGGISGSQKRAAVQYGCGQYLYGLDVSWADVHDEGELLGYLPKKKGGDRFNYDPPELPAWALPVEDGGEAITVHGAVLDYLRNQHQDFKGKRLRIDVQEVEYDAYVKFFSEEIAENYRMARAIQKAMERESGIALWDIEI